MLPGPFFLFGWRIDIAVDVMYRAPNPQMAYREV